MFLSPCFLVCVRVVKLFSQSVWRQRFPVVRVQCSVRACWVAKLSGYTSVTHTCPTGAQQLSLTGQLYLSIYLFKWWQTYSNPVAGMAVSWFCSITVVFPESTCYYVRNITVQYTQLYLRVTRVVGSFVFFYFDTFHFVLWNGRYDSSHVSCSSSIKDHRVLIWSSPRLLAMTHTAAFMMSELLGR